MKKVLIVFIPILLLYACKKEDYNYLDGVYLGSFSCRDTNYFSQISFSNGDYEEYLSGGAYFQKIPCNTEGKYRIGKAEIFFFPKEICNTCPLEKVLVGNFGFLVDSNTIFFSKKVNGIEVFYNLEKMDY